MKLCIRCPVVPAVLVPRAPERELFLVFFGALLQHLSRVQESLRPCTILFTIVPYIVGLLCPLPTLKLWVVGRALFVDTNCPDAIGIPLALPSLQLSASLQPKYLSTQSATALQTRIPISPSRQEKGKDSAVHPLSLW